MTPTQAKHREALRREREEWLRTYRLTGSLDAFRKYHKACMDVQRYANELNKLARERLAANDKPA